MFSDPPITHMPTTTPNVVPNAPITNKATSGRPAFRISRRLHRNSSQKMAMGARYANV